ncbi:MAG: hypothetical protein LUE27_02185 [Clostridia bacterium]|nr:hypothetical protein [Clostridia bacterium]
MIFADDILLGEQKEYSKPEIYSDEAYEEFMCQAYDGIKHMTAYDGDEMVLRMGDVPAGKVCSVRVYNDRRLGKTDLFHMELHIRQKDGSSMAYVYAGDRYETFCMIRNFLDVGGLPWNLAKCPSKESVDSEYGIIKDDEEKRRLSGIISHYMNGNVGNSSLFPEYWQALGAIMDYDPNPGYSKEIVGELWEKDFAKILEFAERYPYDPVFAKAAGDIELNGYIGRRNRKKAYEYYKFASERGYLAARLALAEMYRDGMCVEKDFDTYRSLVLSIYEEFISAGGACAMVCINYAIPEIAKVYLEDGEPEKAGEALIQGLSSSMSLWPYGIPVNGTDAKLADMLYKVYVMPEDKHEIADLLVLLKSPCSVLLTADGKEYGIEAVQDGKDILVKYDGKYFRDPVSFMNTAVAGNKLIRELDMESMKVLKE